MSANGHGGVLKRIDALDRRILVALHGNPQVSNKEIAEALRASEATIATRIENMIAGKIMKITVQRNIRMGKYPMVGMIDVYTEGRDPGQVADELAACEQVLSATIFCDAPQVQLTVMAADPAHLRSIVEDELGVIKGVRRADVTIFLDFIYLAPGIAGL